jgi:hypothetical protein
MNYTDRGLEKSEYQLPDIFIKHVTGQLLNNKGMSNEEGYKRLVNAVDEGKVSGAWLKRIKNLYDTNENFMTLIGIAGKNWVETKLETLRSSGNSMKKLKTDLGLNPIVTRDRSGYGKVNEGKTIIITESMASLFGISNVISENIEVAKKNIEKISDQRKI